MKHKWIILGLSFWLAGCATLPEQETTPAVVPTPIGTQAAIGSPTPTVVETPPPTEEPFTKDIVFLEVAELQSSPDQPGLVLLHVEGQLPTACHQLGTAVCPSCVENFPNLIEVNVYSLIETGKTCRGPTTPFLQDIPLGVFTEGIYVVQVNGQHIGEFDAATFGKEVEMVRGTVFIEGMDLISPESYNEPATLVVQGYLPTPCNIFSADVSAPNENGEIQIDAYSLAPIGAACIDVIQDFTSEVPLGQLPPGSYSVWVNGENVGDVVVP
jgi:hypothetical protein